METSFKKYAPREGAPRQAAITAFIEAAGNGDLAAVADFLRCYGEAYINRRDYDEDTALTMAAWQGRTEVVRFLLAHGADMDIQNHEHCTALMYAEKKPFPEIASLLRQEEAARLVRKGIPKEMQAARPLRFRKKRRACPHAK